MRAPAVGVARPVKERLLRAHSHRDYIHIYIYIYIYIYTYVLRYANTCTYVSYTGTYHMSRCIYKGFKIQCQPAAAKGWGTETQKRGICLMLNLRVKAAEVVLWGCARFTQE